MDPATVLEEAADLLLLKGRCKVYGVDAKGRYCVLGAIAAVQGKTWTDEDEGAIYEDDPAVDALAATVGPLVDAFERANGWGPCGKGVPSTYVYFWNDVLPDDDFEVIDTLRLVAKDLRNEA